MKEKDKEPGYYLEFDKYRGQTLFFGRDFIAVNQWEASESPQGRRLNRDADAGEKITPDMLMEEPQEKPEFLEQAEKETKGGIMMKNRYFIGGLSIPQFLYVLCSWILAPFLLPITLGKGKRYKEEKTKINASLKEHERTLNTLRHKAVRIRTHAVGTLRLKDGDLIVLKTPNRLSQYHHTILLEEINELIGSLDIKCKAIILEEGMDLGVLRKEA